MILNICVRKLLTAIFLFIVLIQLVQAAEIQKINSYVTDNANVLSPSAKAGLELQLRDLEKQTNGVQYVIFIENSYPKDLSLEEHTLKIAEDNKIGKKGNDNGILLYVAIDDRKYRWETGYGVEGTLNSALLGRISREYLVPNFQSGDYEKGILSAFDVTKRILMNSNDADILKLKESAANGSTQVRIFVILFFIVFILLIAFFIYSIKNPKQGNSKNKNSYYRNAASGIFIGGFGRGGFGGSGGFGGLSGGGGGFGGGGGSGGW